MAAMARPLTDSQMHALRAAPMFSALGEGSLRSLLSSCRVLRRPGGSHVFVAGRQAHAFYVVLAGQVKVHQISPRGDEQILHLYGAGNSFGEAAVLSAAAYPAFAETTEDSVLLEVTRAALRGAIQREPELAMGMLAGLSGKLREFVRLIEALSLKEVPARLAAELLDQSRQAGSRTFRLRQTKRQLAAQLGTIAETLSRALAKLRSKGLVSVRGSEVTIEDPEGLKELAES